MTDWTVGHSDHCRRHVFQHCSFSIKGSLPCLWLKYVDKEDIWTRQPNTHTHILPSLYLIYIFTQICIHAHKHKYTHTHINVTVKSEYNIFYLYFSLCLRLCLCLFEREINTHREILTIYTCIFFTLSLSLSLSLSIYINIEWSHFTTESLNSIRLCLYTFLAYR
jgi:hypothetical protein